MPFPDATGWVPNQQLSGLAAAAGVAPAVYATFTAGVGENGAPPQHIVDYLASVGTPWDPAKYSWDPNTGNLTDRASGSSWDMRSVPNNSLGSYVVLPGGATRTAESGGAQVENNILPGGGPAYYFEPGQGPTFFGNPEGEGQFFFSNDPSAIDEYQHDARTRQLQGAAQVAALVGGAAALGGAGAGSSAGTGGAGTAAGGLSPITTTASTLPGGVPAVTGAGFGGTTAATGLAAMPALGGAAGGAAAGGAGAALGGSGAGNFLSNWLPTIGGGVNALLGYRAAGEASDAQSAAAQAAIDEQRRQFDTTRSDLMPWLTAGQGALTNLQDPQNAFTASPGYDWRRTEGTRDIGNSFAARGGAASGNALRALSEFNQGLASGEFNSWWNQQAGLAGVGQNTAVNLGGLGQNTAGNIGNALQNQGVARASGVLGRYSALGQGLTSGIENWLYRRR